MSRGRPFATVVIPTWNSFATKKGSITLVLESLFRQRADPFEVIVVDDGSADGTPDALETLRKVRPRHVSLKLLRLKHTGNRSVVRNRGVRRSRSSNLVFMDDDTIFLSDDGLERLLSRVARGAFACGAARYWSYLDWTPEAVRERLRAGDYRSLEERSVFPRGKGVSSRGFSAEFSYVANCGAVHASDFRRIGGFEEDGYGGWGLEDVDLMLRLVAARTRLVNVHEEIAVLHLTHPVDEAGHSRREENLRRFRRRERELGLRLNARHLFRLSRKRLRPSAKDC